MDRTDWWRHLDPGLRAPLRDIWIPVGSPGFAGAEKARWRAVLDDRFEPDGWRLAHIVRGAVVTFGEAIREYESSYRRYLRDRPALVRFITTTCGNVYDYAVENVHDDDYDQPATEMNHYQDISVRRVVSELVDDPGWPDVVDTPEETVSLVDLGTGERHEVARARGFRGDYLLQIRDPLSPGYALNPAVVPVHDPALITTLPSRTEWYPAEGCGHLSVEAFWQMSMEYGKRLVVTFGSRGVLIVDGSAGTDRSVAVTPVPVVGTTVGCGDAFIAHLLEAWWRTGDLETAVERGKVGGAMPTPWVQPLPDEAYGPLLAN